jgi:hypothetical protein
MSPDTNGDSFPAPGCGYALNQTEDPPTQETDRALAGHDPIRVDVIDAEGPKETVTTEERQER